MNQSPPGWSRRAFLAATAGLATTTGCVGRSSSNSAVTLLVAGSLQNALTTGFEPPADTRIEVEAHGSARAARMVADQQRDPDIVALADPALFTAPLSVPWYATFANNAVVLAYNPSTPEGKRFESADTWFAPLLDGGVRLGRTDPDLDPLGYRTRFALTLAADYYDRPALGNDLLSREQIYPETQLLAQFDAGSIDAAFVYRSMAVERGYPSLDLPAAINLSDPEHASSYATTSYTLPDGVVVRGSPIQYAATQRTKTEAATAVFDALVETATEYLESHGFTVHAEQPTYSGDVPTTR
ncbi:ABC transporter substrate-binding protein [Haloferax mediterranei ATCC 33500]|uniref:ABC transporter substrate-binding protein n=1 Tax=Haloferax mediterranei (strain ATCC 33500 / DSM 1411 / JCM 8866 / NBRC 14739 / NCIMB 2177 / R-4) TaxID=523841 RepID=I3R6P5_HALMT|nr:extracellular solute-binding protein [Haloferax mediterranei]AFK19905.1 ABC transporter substrate-binding protein [Haloferax mediterranei ATCC 33500]AHZ23284.1 ABC transporter substrate-binding protein [Haloferax mediterranei ATCC 33500]ELZ99449.1 ABC transporter substrate-binding protein [Haloferax mediterranei ATCC 33500]MDX5987346.1 extracellular solute-binding protein [Haloferax mediterranei ATCC 33500]QCQ73858.1 ABC transporter substrate-binding protein [Haloferax mediterranei ATCC 335